EQPLERLVVQREVRDQMLEPAVFVLQLPKPPCLRDLQSAVLRFPPIESLLRNALLPADLLRRLSRLPFLQHSYDLFLGELFCAHAVLLSIPGGSDISRGPTFGEQVTSRCRGGTFASGQNK